MSPTFSIRNGTQQKIPAVPFLRIKEKVLGKKYDLSLVFIDETRMRTLNTRYRNKKTSTDILSFPLDTLSGEMFISMNDVQKKAKKFSLSTKQYLGFLFIHGLLHLKGLDHGRTMERQENSWCRTFSIPSPNT
ncbi:rRNA maturation RNase YbeY [Candidatus Kaiserbacteria bacterium CG10_big_fil_rev_8_21_14_0_10_45_20]|uniref:Endoribonuclease YbeY n=1 Tax=Candidatus Kaiserbacteria bacterium CG10_big_fil_rev_8_21_14_0_10_45_20 TaxID=1974607 RepID=A0A2H0UHY1_9BACT|nr:MAG: rRNA maturation RNase YbeY [Candidatus Kaiserbacteria bacterium CG10_big_fil_rev_8_21_14_0_10_45_20]